MRTIHIRACVFSAEYGAVAWNKNDGAEQSPVWHFDRSGHWANSSLTSSRATSTNLGVAAPYLQPALKIVVHPDEMVFEIDRPAVRDPQLKAARRQTLGGTAGHEDARVHGVCGQVQLAAELHQRGGDVSLLALAESVSHHLLPAGPIRGAVNLRTLELVQPAAGHADYVELILEYEKRSEAGVRASLESLVGDALPLQPIRRAPDLATGARVRRAYVELSVQDRLRDHGGDAHRADAGVAFVAQASAHGLPEGQAVVRDPDLGVTRGSRNANDQAVVEDEAHGPVVGGVAEAALLYLGETLAVVTHPDLDAVVVYVVGQGV